MATQAKYRRSTYPRIVDQKIHRFRYTADQAKQIGERFRRAREERDLTGQQVADVFGLTSSAIFMAESGITRTLDPYIDRYMVVFNKPREYFLPWLQQPEPVTQPTSASSPTQSFQDLLDDVMQEAEQAVLASVAAMTPETPATPVTPADEQRAYEDEVTEPESPASSDEVTTWSLGWRLMKAFEQLDPVSQQALVDLVESVLPKSR